jgi:hypothetical protein
MCIIALHMAGSSEREAVRTAVDWLLNREKEWLRAGHEIDLALTVEVLATVTDEPFDSHLRDLLARAMGELDAMPAARPEERLRRPFLAAQLAQIVWETVHNEFIRLLRDVMSPESAETVTAEVVAEAETAAEPAVEVRPVPEPCGLTDYQLRRWEDACEDLSRMLQAYIDSRSSPQFREAPLVQRELRERLAQRNNFTNLRDQLGPRAPRAVLEELDHLGRDLRGLAWPDLPYPDRYCDDDQP